MSGGYKKEVEIWNKNSYCAHNAEVTQGGGCHTMSVWRIDVIQEAMRIVTSVKMGMSKLRR